MYICVYIYIIEYTYIITTKSPLSCIEVQEATYVLRVLPATEEATVAEEGRRFVVVPLTQHLNIQTLQLGQETIKVRYMEAHGASGSQCTARQIEFR